MLQSKAQQVFPPRKTDPRYVGICEISTKVVHSSAGVHRPKENPDDGGGLFLTKGERELEAPM